MRNRSLGSTGVEVSEIALGTVELGLQYGFRDSPHYQQPDPDAAIRLLRLAFDCGITLVDTAPTYGTAEELIGRAFAGMSKRPLIATKVIVPDDGNLDLVTASVEKSLRLLRADTLDVLQVHNASTSILRHGDLFDCLEKLRHQGKIRFLGVSVNDEESAWLALTNESIETLQTPFNLLNQKMRHRVFPAALERPRGMLIRSAFLRGVLTEQLESIPSRLDALKTAARSACEIVGSEASRLSEVALRFCLSFQAASSVILGMRSEVELERNLIAWSKGPLSERTMQDLARVAIEDEELVNPIYWKDLI
ncbi:MAG: aldo/keto reductase [Candidatus Sulfotelmatobacter sp.]